MLSDIELNIIAGFFPRPRQRLLPLIQHRVNYSQEEIYATLKSLASRKIVEFVWLGGATLFTLSVESEEAADGYQFYVKLKRSEFNKLYPDVARLAEKHAGEVEESIVLLCGTYARGTAKPEDSPVLLGVSDVDTPYDSKSSARTLLEEPKINDNGTCTTCESTGGSTGTEEGIDEVKTVLGVKEGEEDHTSKDLEGSKGGNGKSSIQVKYVRITKKELRGMRISDADTFRDIVNFAFPVKGVALYYSLIYRVIGL